MKNFLLTAGHNYYPSMGDGDWIDFYETRAAAEAEVVKIGGTGLNWGDVEIKGKTYDWYYIIDIQNWSKE